MKKLKIKLSDESRNVLLFIRILVLLAIPFTVLVFVYNGAGPCEDKTKTDYSDSVHDVNRDTTYNEVKIILIKRDYIDFQTKEGYVMKVNSPYGYKGYPIFYGVN